MAWIRIDDQMPDHPKIEPLTDSAFRWIFRGLSYANRFLTNGVLLDPFLARVPASVKDELVIAGVWTVGKTGKVRIHDYHEYQPSKAEIERQRAMNRDRQTRFRESRNALLTGDKRTRNDTPSRPDPARRTKKNPQPPTGVGGSRIKERDVRQAQKVLKQWGLCAHKPVPCTDHKACLARIAQDLANERTAITRRAP